MKISKDLKKAVKEAASELSPNNKKVLLEKPFNGAYVTSDSEQRDKSSGEFSFTDVGLEREGNFFLCLDGIME